MAFAAKYSGTCYRCKGPIEPGMSINAYNIPAKGTRYHATCPGTPHPETAHPAMATQPAPDATMLRDALKALLGDMPSGGMDEDRIQEIVDNRLQQYSARNIEVTLPSGETTAVEGAHYFLERAIKLLAAGFNLYLWGPAGSGKTTAALQVAKALGRECELDTLDPTTFRSMIQGSIMPTGNHAETAFTRCWEQGKVYIPDETDLAPGHVQTLFNSALANGHAPLAWGSIERPEGFGFIGTGNTPGRATRAFPDRKAMSAAFMDRLYFVYWPIDPAIECRVAGLPIPAPPQRNVRTCTPQAWGKWVMDVREYCKDNAPTVMVTPRATILGIKAMECGEGLEEIADGLVFRGADPELRNRILSGVPLP